jgi:hypothetical protein
LRDDGCDQRDDAEPARDNFRRLRQNRIAHLQHGRDGHALAESSQDATASRILSSTFNLVSLNPVLRFGLETAPSFSY